MGLKYTPKSDLIQAPDFNLLGVDDAYWNLDACIGPKGLVVLFICNHCPYVKSIQKTLVEDAKLIQSLGVNVGAIMSNDVADYPEDSFENMQRIAAELRYPFPYLIDSTQAVAKAYGAVCTPDIFAMDGQRVIQYRGRLNAAGINQPSREMRKDLVEAMREMVATGVVSSEQFPSMGCSIKWTQYNT